MTRSDSSRSRIRRASRAVRVTAAVAGDAPRGNEIRRGISKVPHRISNRPRATRVRTVVGRAIRVASPAEGNADVDAEVAVEVEPVSLSRDRSRATPSSSHARVDDSSNPPIAANSKRVRRNDPTGRIADRDVRNILRSGSTQSARRIHDSVGAGVDVDRSQARFAVSGCASSATQRRGRSRTRSARIVSV